MNGFIQQLVYNFLVQRIQISVLDYGAGNVRSLRNAIKAIGYNTRDITCAADILLSEAIIFPGQGSFKQAMKSLRDRGWVEPLRQYLRENRPFFGICLGMQLLFEGSEESPGDEGLSIILGRVYKFDATNGARVPQIGWNGISPVKLSKLLENVNPNDTAYFVHSFFAKPCNENLDWILGLTDYGNERYISMVEKGNISAAQFHPEKSGVVGLRMIQSFIQKFDNSQIPYKNNINYSSDAQTMITDSNQVLTLEKISQFPTTHMVKRIVACLDVRSNDDGDLVVTKGDQYDVREQNSDSIGRGDVRNLGKPVALCQRYYEDGADEIVFLNITSFRQGVLEDLPMLQVLESASQNVFVPLTVGGGIREYVDSAGKVWSALDVAARYFRAGADKISIGSDAVYAAEDYYKLGGKTIGQSAIEQISNHYGAQAVVVSIDPKRVYLSNSDQVAAMETESKVNTFASKTIVKLSPEDQLGPNGEEYCWWQVTVKGGRESRDLDAVQVAKACEALGAGEIMLNCIDKDGQNNGYDVPLIRAVSSALTIPVIASSGAGNAQHFVDVFEQTSVNAALAAGIFHRNEAKIKDVKEYICKTGKIPVRI